MHEGGMNLFFLHFGGLNPSNTDLLMHIRSVRIATLISCDDHCPKHWQVVSFQQVDDMPRCWSESAKRSWQVLLKKQRCYEVVQSNYCKSDWSQQNLCLGTTNRRCTYDEMHLDAFWVEINHCPWWIMSLKAEKGICGIYWDFSYHSHNSPDT